MTSKQLSVFIENRKGRLSEVLEVLKANNVNILSMSLKELILKWSWSNEKSLV